MNSLRRQKSPMWPLDLHHRIGADEGTRWNNHHQSEWPRLWWTTLQLDSLGWYCQGHLGHHLHCARPSMWAHFKLPHFNITAAFLILFQRQWGVGWGWWGGGGGGTALPFPCANRRGGGLIIDVPQLGGSYKGWATCLRCNCLIGFIRDVGFFSCPPFFSSETFVVQNSTAVFHYSPS